MSALEYEELMNNNACYHALNARTAKLCVDYRKVLFIHVLLSYHDNADLSFVLTDLWICESSIACWLLPAKPFLCSAYIIVMPKRTKESYIHRELRCVEAFAKQRSVQDITLFTDDLLFIS